MRVLPVHPFNFTPRQAMDLQLRLAKRVSTRSFSGEVRTLAGADVSYDFSTGCFFAAVIVLSWPGQEVLEIARSHGRVRFPYVPGLLSFRELPPILNALRRLRTTPDLLFCDGQGLAHPRFFGLACHLGLFVGIPTIGCAKSLLVGEHSRVPRCRGGYSTLTFRDRQVGVALRTREGVREIFVSPGHRISIQQAADWAMRSAGRFRIPEPTRLADKEVSRMRREGVKQSRRPKFREGLC